MSFASASAFWAPFGISAAAFWPFFLYGSILGIGICRIPFGANWKQAGGLDKFILLAPLFYAPSIGAFGAEHFTSTITIAGFIPAWIPWHIFWTYLVGTSLIAAALSMVTKVQTRLASGLLGLMFFLFVVLMHVPNWTKDPRDRFALAILFRDLSFSGGALALAGSLSRGWRERGSHILSTIGRYFIAVPVLFYAVEQFLHPEYVPGITLNRITPQWIPGHIFWSYVASIVYLVTGAALVFNRKTRWAATWLGVMVFVLVLFVYGPIWAATPGSVAKGLNYFADTLMLGGAALFLARAIPKEPPAHSSEMAAGNRGTIA